MRSNGIPLRSLALLSLLAGCAAPAAERTFVAPSNETVHSRLELTDGGVRHVLITNSSTVPIVVNGVTLSDCVNIKNRCELVRMRTTVAPGRSVRVLTVRTDNGQRPSSFRYSPSWEAGPTRIPGVTAPSGP